MSADNWGICPKCAEKEHQEYKELSRQVDEMYGKVSQSKFLAMVAELEYEGIEAERTLREDFEMYTNPDGKFFIKYNCYCHVCEFSFQFKHVEQLKWSDK